ncbi:conserved Plasmodium protein, unknown function [Plasmodium gallinaceum]|uniref:RNA-binding protein n=1 Tax=Plasmodium gallinaceum TaxID=5849 RepID=A0A1J1GZC6_PLAGA|nr:conserved Plasmodium protein, unknown function [Plasmodium gallinaceum]CRG96371.1 conserved Plasmodium protein, unknown function [Plasmodium gallinaceum]
MQGAEHNNDIFSTNDKLNMNSLSNNILFDKNMNQFNRLKISSVSTEAYSYRCSTNSLSNNLSSNNINNYDINFSSTSNGENDYILNALKELGNKYNTNKDFNGNCSVLNSKPCSLTYNNETIEQNENDEEFFYRFEQEDKNSEKNNLINNMKNDGKQKNLLVCTDKNKLNLSMIENNENKLKLCNEDIMYKHNSINRKAKLLSIFEKANETTSNEVQLNAFNKNSNNIFNNVIKISENMKNNNKNIRTVNVKDIVENKKEKKLVNNNEDIENKCFKNIIINNVNNAYNRNKSSITIIEDDYNNNFDIHKNKNNDDDNNINYNDNNNKDKINNNDNNNKDNFNKNVDISENNNNDNNNKNYNNYNVLFKKCENEALNINNSEDSFKNNKFIFNMNKKDVLFDASENLEVENNINKDNNNFNLNVNRNLINVSNKRKDSLFKNNLNQFFENIENDNSGYRDNKTNYIKSNKSEEKTPEHGINKMRLPFINLSEVNKNSCNISDSNTNKHTQQNYFDSTFGDALTNTNETKEMENFDENYFYDLKSDEVLFFEKERNKKNINSNKGENLCYLNDTTIENTNNFNNISFNFSEYINEYKNNYNFKDNNGITISNANLKLLEKNLLKENSFIFTDYDPFNKTNENVESNTNENFNIFQNYKENNNIYIKDKTLDRIYNNNENLDKLSDIDKISIIKVLKNNKNDYISESLNDKGNTISSSMNNENYNSFSVIDNFRNSETVNSKKLIFLDKIDERIFLNNKMNSKDISNKNFDKDTMNIYNINHSKHVSNGKLLLSENLNSYNLVSNLINKNDDFLNSCTDSKFNFKNKFYEDYIFPDSLIDEKKAKYEDIMKYFDYSINNNNNINCNDNNEETNSKDTDSKSKNSLAKFTLIVNVPPNTTRKDLMAVFSKFGNVDLTMVVCDKQSRHPNKEWTATSGYAFVRFATNLEAQRTLNATTSGLVRIRGSRVRATWAKKDSYSKREKETTFKIPSSILILNVEEFICSICKTNLSYEPRLFPCCYASCCSDCLRSYIMNEENQENIKCPNCSLSFSERIIKIDKNSKGAMALLYKFHCNIKVRCPNECCEWIGFQYQYLNHILSCKFNQT